MLEQVQRNYVKMTLKQISSLQQGVVISKPGLLMIFNEYFGLQKYSLGLNNSPAIFSGT